MLDGGKPARVARMLRAFSGGPLKLMNPSTHTLSADALRALEGLKKGGARWDNPMTPDDVSFELRSFLDAEKLEEGLQELVDCGLAKQAENQDETNPWIMVFWHVEGEAA